MLDMDKSWTNSGGPTLTWSTQVRSLILDAVCKFAEQSAEAELLLQFSAGLQGERHF